MKLNIKKSFKINFVFTIALMVVFCFACLAGANLNNNFNNVTPAYAEEVVSDESVGDDSLDAGGETGDTSSTTSEEEVDVSTYEKWEDNAEIPLIAEDVGSVSTSSKKVIISSSDPLTAGAQLAWVAKQVNDNISTYSLFSGWTIELQSDVNLGGKIWTSIGYNSSYKFKGTFNGNGHIINGLTFESSSSYGLFRYCQGATIKDVIIQNCVNASSYALVGAAGVSSSYNTIFNCCSIGVGLANSSYNYIRHCISNGTNSSSYFGTYSSKPIGVNQSYYVTEISDLTGELSSTALSAGAKEGTLSASTRTINIDSSSVGYFEYHAVTSVKFYYLVVNSASAGTYKWQLASTISMADATRVYSTTSFKFTIDSGGDNATRSFPSASGVTSVSNLSNGTYTIGYVHQTAVKIVIELDWRYVNTTASLKAIATGTTYNQLSTLYSSQNGYVATWSNDITSASSLTVATSGSSLTLGSSALVEYGSMVTISESYSQVIKLGAVYNSGYSSYITTQYANWDGDGSISVELDENIVFEYSNQLYSYISVRFMNMYRLKLNNAKASLGTNVNGYQVVNVDQTTSGIDYAYHVNSVATYTSTIFRHRLDYTTNMMDTISNIYISNNSVTAKSLNGTSCVYETYTNVPATRYSSTATTVSGWTLSNDMNLYCAWILKSKTITLSKVSNSYLILEGKVTNPYTNTVSALSTSIGTSATSFNTYATYIVRLYNTTTNTNALNANVMLVKTTGDYDNVVGPYSATRFDEGSTTITSTQGSISNNYNGKTQGANVVMYDSATYTLQLKPKEVYLDVDFMVYNPTSKTVTSTFDVIDDTYMLYASNGTESQTLTRDASVSDKVNAYNTFNPEFYPTTTLFKLTHNTITIDKITIDWQYKSTNYATYKFYEFWAPDYKSNTSFLNLRSYSNTFVQFDFAPSYISDGATIKLVIVVEPYTADFDWDEDDGDAKLIYDIDYSANKTFYHFANPTIDYTDPYAIKLTAQVKYMTFNELKLNGTKIYDVDGGSYTFASQTVSVSGTVSSGITLTLGNTGSTITISTTNKTESIGTTGQVVVFTFNKLPYSSTSYSVLLGYDRIEYSYIALAQHIDNDSSICGSAKDTRTYTYIDTLKYSRDISDTDDAVFTHTYYDTTKSTFTNYTKTFTAKDYFTLSDASIMERKGVDLLNSLAGGNVIDFIPSGIDIDIIGTDTTNADNTYVKENGSQGIVDYTNAKITNKTVNYYTFKGFVIVGDTSKTEYQTIEPSVIKYSKLVTYVSNKVLTVNANYEPIEYTLQFKKSGTVQYTDKETYSNTATINDYLEEAGKLSTFLKDGYKLTFKSGSYTFGLSDTIQEVIASRGSKTATSTITLEAVYTAKSVKYNFILKGESVPVETYTTTYGTTIDWETLILGIAKTLLTDREVLVTSWDEKISASNVAKYQTYSVATSSFTYTYTNWAPSAYSETFDIVGTFNSVSISAIFNGYYLTNETDVKTTVAFGSNEYATVPTPTRTGYTFAYWKAVDSKGDTYYVYNGSVTGTTTTVITGDASLTFYAYWNVDERTFTLNGYSGTYDATSHNVAIISLNALIPDMNNTVALYKEDGTAVTSTRSNTSIMYTAKYVADSGKFYAVYTYNYVTSSASAPNSAYYIINKPTSTKSGLATITISAKQLTVASAITKEYDGTTSVLQSIEGIYDADKNTYKITAKYASSGAGTNIAVSYTVTCSNSLIKNSYAVPTTTKGIITPRKIYANISGTITHPGVDTEKIVVSEGSFSGSGATFTIAKATVKFTNESTVATLLGTTRTLLFKIQTINSVEAVLDVDDFVVELIENGTTCVDFEIVINQSTFEISGLEDDQRGFTFYAIVHPNHPNYSTASISDYVYSISMTGSKKINDYSFNIIKEPVSTGDTLSFAVAVDFKNANWWLLDARVVDTRTGDEQVVSVNLFEDGTANFNYTVGANKAYNVYLQFTNISNVSYELGLIDNEKATTYPSSTTVQYGSTFTFPTPARSGLSFSKWFYIDNAGEQAIIDKTSTAWSIKGDVVLYALWTYNTTITLAGTNVSAQYEPNKSYTLTATNSNTTNTYLGYSHIWGRATSQNGTYVAIDAENQPMTITLHNVADSGYYGFTFDVKNIPYYLGEYLSIGLNVTYKNNVKFSINITLKELELLNTINKQYDGEKTLTYTITTADVSSTYSEVANQSVVITYASAELGATIATIIASSDSVIAKNYTLSASGAIIKREVTINIGVQKFVYTGSVASYTYGEETLDTIKISNIVVKTTGVNVDLYTQAENELTISFEAVLTKNNASVSPSYFNFTINGSIEIQAKTFASSDVKIIWTKTYNTGTQNVSVYVLGSLISNYYTVKKDNSTFSGAVNAGTYTNVTVAINYPNYATYTETNAFVINPYSVYVDVTTNSIYKIYDGTVTINTLTAGTDYTLYADSAKTTQVSTTHSNNIVNNSLLSFVFGSATAGKDKAVELQSNSTNYAFTLLNSNLKGEIAKKSITLAVTSVSKYYDEKTFEVSVDKITASGLISGATLSGKIVIKITEANTYGLSSLNVSNYFDFSNLKVGTNSISDNYSISAVSGSAEIKKANLTVSLVQTEYVYTGTVQDIKFLAIRENDGEDVTSVLQIVSGTNTGISVGNYTVGLEIKAEHLSNYNFTSNTYAYSIVVKNVILKVREHKVYDGVAFTYYLNNINDLLCVGHSFGNSFARTRAVYFGDYDYTEGDVELNVKVIDASSADVTSNYSFTYDIILTIGKDVLTADRIVKSDLEYNSQIRTLSFTVDGNTISFAGQLSSYKTSGYDGYRYYNAGKEIIVTFARLNNSGTSIDSDFKYASTYKVNLTSNMYEDYSFEVTIKPKTITSFVADTTKEYDGTTDVIGDITSADIFESDKKYVYLEGKYGTKIVGATTITVELKFNTPASDEELDNVSFNLLKASYKLTENLSVSAEITARAVIFVYTSNDMYYYNGKKLTLDAVKFTLSNMIASENFGGSVDFTNVINAGTYNLAEQDVDISGLTITEGSSFEYYTITFVGNFVVNKAQVVVNKVSNNTHTYSAEAKQATLSAYIYSSRGEITSGIANELIIGKYKQTTSGNFVTPINVGSYYIYPEINSVYSTNYQYVGDTYLGTSLTPNMLEIVKRDVTVVANKEIVYDNADTSYELLELETKINNVVSGHSFEGNVNIDSKVYAIATFLYKTGNITTGVTLTNFDILDGNDSVLANYNVTYDITIVIVETVGLGQSRALAKKDYEYNSTNQINDIVIIVEVGTASGIQTIEIELDTQSEYAKIVGYYASLENAQNGTSSLSTIKNVGVYYVKVVVDVNGTSTFAGEYKYAPVKVVQKAISKASLSYNNVAYLGIREYNSESSIVLQSTDVYEADKSIVTITATYYLASNNQIVSEVGSGYIVRIVLSGTGASNYALDTTKLDGCSITKRTVTIIEYVDSAVYYYKGSQTITLTSDKFVIDGEVSGHTLAGSVVLSIQNAGEYAIGGGENNFTIWASSTDVSENYKIEISEDVVFVMNRAQIIIAWTGGELTYNAQERLAEIKASLTLTGDYKTGAISDLSLIFNDSITTIKDAGSYTITSATSLSDNFAYTIDESNRTIRVNQKEASISLGLLEVKYKDYKIAGYNLNYNMVTGGYPLDQDAFVASVYKVNGTHKANTTYYAEDGQNQATGGAFVEYNSIVIVFNSVIETNYKITAITGGIKIIPENVTFEEITPFTYNGTDRFDELVITYISEDGTTRTITSSDTTNGSITKQIIKDAGEYSVEVIISTAIYNRTVVVNALTISSIDVMSDKQYDGTNVVYGTSYNTNLTSKDVIAGDDITITATYDGYRYSETAYAISFTKSGSDADNYILPGNYSGKILKRSVTFNFGSQSLVYSLNNTYQVELDTAPEVIGGVVTAKVVAFSLKDNNVCKNIVLSTANATFDLSGFTIKKDTEDVTDCYDIALSITITITAKQFSVEFKGYDNNQVIYDASSKQVTITYVGLTEQEINTVASSVVIKYSYTDTGDSLAGGTYPVNVGKYTASVVYGGSSNFAITGDVDYEYEIIPYTYSADAGAISSFVKEYALEDPELVQAFTVTLAGGSHTFKITYSREAGENIGKYDLILQGEYCDSANITFVASQEALADKFEIIKNTSSIVLITINSYKACNFVKYYGFKNIGLFDITEFNYTATVLDKTVSAGITAGTVLYNSGSVGYYDVNSCELESQNFTRFEIASDIQLQIKPRTLVISSDSYDKVYDGTNTFVNSIKYNYNVVELEGTLSQDDIQALGEVIIAVFYESEEAGTWNLQSTLSTHIGNFNVTMEKTTGTIAQLEVAVNVETQEIIYGESVSVDFTIDYADGATVKPFTIEQLKSFVTVVVSGMDTSKSTAGFTKAGEYAISVITGANLINTTTQNAKVIIKQKEITVSVSPRIYKIQDGTADIDLSNYTVTVDGVFDRDIVSVQSATFSSSNSGTNKTISFTLGGADSENYKAKTTLGDIGQRLITFNFVYAGYTGCPITLAQLNSATVTVKSIIYDYYNSITATNPNSLPAPAFIGKGYEMVGWSTTTDTTGIIDPAVKISEYVSPYEESISVYAIWEIQEFDITLYQSKYNFKTNSYDSTLLTTVSLDYMEQLDVSTYASEVTHYAYVGYGVGNTNQLYTTNYVVEDTATLYLVYNLDKHTVVLDANGGVFSNQTYLFEYVNAGRATFEVYYGQQIGEAISLANLNKYTVATRTGYTFASWSVGVVEKTLTELSATAITGDTTITAVWTANQYALTLYGIDGKFSLNAEQLALGWTYVANSGEKTVQILVAYETQIPALAIPVKDYYAFDGYVDGLGALWKEANHTTWTELNEISLYATYVDMDFTLKVTAENASVSLVVKDGNGVIVNVENVSTNANVYLFNVKTSYSATITVEANAGYTFTGYSTLANYGTASNNVYKITSFTQNSEITAVVEANDNTITLKVNNNIFGYISAEISGTVYTSNGNNTFTVKTGEGFIVNAFANEGYAISAWNADGSGSLSELSATSRVLSEFTSDVIVYVELVEKDLNVTIINDSVKGYYVYGETTYTESQTVKVKTGTSVVLTITPNYGYDIIASAFEFETDSDNKGEISVNTVNGKYVVVLSGFTANGTITINYQTKQFTLTFGYAEYDEVTGQINPVANTNEIIAISGVNYKVDEFVSYEYLTSITISPAYTKTGYTFYSFAYLLEGEFVNMVSGVDAQKIMTLTVDNNYNLYLVFQRSAYTVTYRVSSAKHGSVQFTYADERGIEIVETVRYGRKTSLVSANILSYRQFDGWLLNGETLVSTDTTLPSSEVLADATYIADITGSTQMFNVVIYANSKYDVANDINTILTVQNGTVGVASQATDANGNIVITVPVSYTVGESVSVTLALNGYYQVIKNGEASDDFTFEVGAITPASYDTGSNPYKIDLTLRYYSVEIKTDSERAAIFNSIPGKCIGLGANSNFNANGEIMAVAYVQYGGTLVLDVNVQTGYTYVGQEGNAIFTVDGREATLSNITENLSITFKFAKAKYKVTFNTNYPEECLGEALTGVVNKEFVFYIEQDGTTFKNADGSTANLTELIASQVFTNDATNAVFKFEGWSVNNSLGSINRTYLFDQGGVYYYDENNAKVYGFNFFKPVDENGDNVADVDDNGNVMTNLYGAWSLPTYNVTIEYAPATITFEGDYAYHFRSDLGILPIYQDGTLICDYLEIAQGVNVVMYTAPNFDGYRYYGYKLSIDGQIIEGFAEFTMPASEVTITLYYQFKVQVLIEEAVAGANTAFVNTTNEVWVIVGEELSFVATSGQGFKFKHWKLDGAVVDALAPSFKTNATNTAIYTAVFEGNLVEVVLRNINHTEISITIVSKVPDQAVQDMARVGDTVRITVDKVEYGYTLQAISVNDTTNDVTKEAANPYYEYIIKQVDGETGKIYIDSIVNAQNVSVKFSINIANAGTIGVNGVDLTDAVGTYSYNDNINVKVTVNSRYNLIGVTLNGSAVDCATIFTKTINQVNGFVVDQENTIVFEFEKLYWIDVRQTLVGYGTKEAPYLISSAENLAYMAYIINNGRIDQSLNRLYYKVTADIDLAERFWIPIGTYENPFDGTFILGKYKITGASFAERYDHFSWEQYCPGVFGYVTENAEIITEQSMMPTIIMIVALSLIALLVITIIIVILNRRKKKMKRLSENLGVSSIPTKPEIKKQERVENIEQTPDTVDQQVQQILKEAEEKNKQKAQKNIAKKPPKKGE